MSIGLQRLQQRRRLAGLRVLPRPAAAALAAHPAAAPGRWRIVAWRDGSKPLAAAIRGFTWSDHYHLELCSPENRIAGATWPRCRAAWLDPSDPHLDFLIPKGPLDFSDSDWERAWDWMLAHVRRGTPYDLPGVFGFVARQPYGDNDRLFCSEAVALAMEAAGLDLQERIAAHQLTPRDLFISPALDWLNPPAAP